MLRERLDEVEERVQAACGLAGRRRDEITLVAVTKTFPASVIREAWELGLRDFGENYIQEFEDKARGMEILEGIRFHFIGHLQSNKARRAAELFQVIQTVDSARLASRLDQAGRPLEVMIEVKLSAEESKSGTSLEDLAEVIDGVRSCPHLQLAGLMTMPPWSDDPDATRPYFRRLAALGREYGLSALSMGMSHDLEAAIEEGATHIRIGTALFGKRTPKK